MSIRYFNLTVESQFIIFLNSQMTISEEALAAKPKRPLTGYFTFQGQKYKELAGETGLREKIKDLWNKLDEDTRTKYNDDAKNLHEEWKEDMKKWKQKYNVSDEDMKVPRKSKKKGKATEDENSDEDEDKKPVKTKGIKDDRKADKKAKQDKKTEVEEKPANKGKSVKQEGKKKEEGKKAEKSVDEKNRDKSKKEEKYAGEKKKRC